jgi:type I restriction enzyme S subunit
MEVWEVRELQDLATIFNGNSISAKKKKECFSGLTSGTPYIATKDVGFDHSIKYDNGILIPEARSKELKIASQNSVLVCAEGGSAGRKVAHNHRNIHFGNKLFALCPNDETNSKYLYYYCISRAFLQSFMDRMTGLIGGVSIKKFKTIPIPVTSLSEQQRIVAILDETFEGIDAVVANTQQNLTNAKELFESYLNNVFTQKGEGWVEKGLVNISAINYGYTAKASSYPVGPKFLRITDIQNGHVDWQTVPFCKVAEDKHSKHKLFDRDIVFARTGATTGKSYLLINPPDAVVASYLIRLRVTDGDVMPEFLAFFFHTKSYWNAVNVGISGSTQGGFNASKLAELKLPFPPLSGQKNIVAQLESLLSETQHLEAIYQQKLDALSELKQSILQKAFSGELTKEQAAA